MAEYASLPQCSVIMPCFNASATIAAAVQSACRQTLQDIEIIVVDDGSHDGAADIVAALARSDGRIRLLRQDNAGVSAARNTGIAAARARVVALLDADDIWSSDHLATHHHRLFANPRLGVSFSPARFVDMNGLVVGRSWPKLDHLRPVDLLCGNPTTTCSTVVARRDVFKDAGVFRTHMRHNEDQEWLFRVALSGWIIAGDPTPRVDYRISPNGLASDLEGMYRGFQIMLEEARKDAPSLVRRHQARATASMLRYLARRAVQLDLAPKISRRYAFAAVHASPLLAMREPRKTLTTLAAALLPQTMRLPVMQAVSARVVHT